MVSIIQLVHVAIDIKSVRMIVHKHCTLYIDRDFRRGHCKACVGSLLTDAALGNFILDHQLKQSIAAVLRQIENKAGSFTYLAVRYCYIT